MFARFVQLAVSALALLSVSRAEALPVIYGTYYSETSIGVACTSATCRINFSQLPADKLLMVSKVTCYIESAAQPKRLALKITAALAGPEIPTRAYEMSFPAPRNFNSLFFLNANEDVHFLIGQSRYPFVELDLSSGASNYATCTIVGDLVTPIQ